MAPSFLTYSLHSSLVIIVVISTVPSYIVRKEAVLYSDGLLLSLYHLATTDLISSLWMYDKCREVKNKAYRKPERKNIYILVLALTLAIETSSLSFHFWLESWKAKLLSPCWDISKNQRQVRSSYLESHWPWLEVTQQSPFSVPFVSPACRAMRDWPWPSAVAKTSWGHCSSSWSYSAKGQASGCRWRDR